MLTTLKLSSEGAPNQRIVSIPPLPEGINSDRTHFYRRHIQWLKSCAKHKKEQDNPAIRPARKEEKSIPASQNLRLPIGKEIDRYKCTCLSSIFPF